MLAYHPQMEDEFETGMVLKRTITRVIFFLQAERHITWLKAVVALYKVA
jgi:hypothetical protein